MKGSQRLLFPDFRDSTFSRQFSMTETFSVKKSNAIHFWMGHGMYAQKFSLNENERFGYEMMMLIKTASQVPNSTSQTVV